DRAVVGEQHGRNIFHGFAALADLDGVLIGEILACALLRRKPPRARAYGKLEDDDRVRPEAAKHPRDRGVEARENGAHANDRARPDDHAEHGKKRAQLMTANRLESQHQAVGEREPRHAISPPAELRWGPAATLSARDRCRRTVPPWRRARRRSGPKSTAAP